MIFKDLIINKKERFSMGKDELSGKFYVSIPLSNEIVDYEEYYEIQEAVFNLFKNDLNIAMEFIQRCRNRQEDALLFFQPSENRGIPT